MVSFFAEVKIFRFWPKTMDYNNDIVRCFVVTLLPPAELASENDEMPDRLLHPENYHCNSPSPRSSNKSNSSSSKSSRSAASSSQPSQSHSNSSQQSKELVHPVSDDGGGGERLLAVRPQAVYGSVQRRHTEPPSANKQQPQGSIN